MPKGIKKEKKDYGMGPSPSPSPEYTEDKKDEVIKLEDGQYYRTVAGRKVKFNNEYPNGSIHVQLVSNPDVKDYFVFKCIVTPDIDNNDRYFIGYGQCERIPGDKFASLEKAETTAIGRALSHMATNILGAGASDEEINKAVGKNNLQAGVREVINEEIKTNPKAEPDYSNLSETDKTDGQNWAELINSVNDLTELTEVGTRIKKAALSKAITEELRKEFNKKLRALSARKE